MFNTDCEVIRAALSDEALLPSDARVYVFLYLAGQGAQGLVTMRQEEIARGAGTSVRNLFKIMGRLREHGLVETAQQGGAGKVSTVRVKPHKPK